MIRLLVIILASIQSAAFEYSKCDFFISGDIRHEHVCVGKPPQPKDGFTIFYDGQGCDRDPMERPRVDFVTEYIIDPDLSPWDAVQQACGERKPLPSDVHIDDVPFFICRWPDYRSMTHLRFVAAIRPKDPDDPVLRQFSFEIYAMPHELPTYVHRAKRLASELHFDLDTCDDTQ